MKAPQRNKKPKGPLDEAIEALALACESGGELDRDTYISAHRALEQLKARLIEHDAKLNREEAAPAGDDYNRIFEMMLPATAQTAKEADIGKIWWNAENMAEAMEMQAEYLSKGAKSVELQPDEDRPIVSVIVTLERSRAKEILGCDVGPEEWLDLEDRYDAPAP